MPPAPDTPAAPDFAAAHAVVCALCDHFDAGRADFTDDAYKEAEARAQFITPFFEALGWDVDNAAHRSVYEKDVVVEKRQDIGGHALSADYAFRRPGSHLTAFFAEAKKPSRDIRNHQDCYQAVQYGWNAKTPLVVLTNFAQLFVLDARAEPDKENSTRFILRHGGTYASRDYRDPEKFAELWGLLARASVAAGSLDRAAAALPRLSGRLQRDDLFARGTGPVDETFLAEMEGWRERLAKQFKKDNHHLDGERLTALTQRILDRLVFLRFLEDRGIEREVTFAAIGKGDSAWHDFLSVSTRLDRRYNGIIYKPDPSGCEDADLVVDDVVFAGVARRFAPENSKYLFNSISVTILGSIYERFLGNVIVSRNKTAIVEPKPEVRKAGGVYYTPDYIVRYIVEQTVGRAIDGKKPADIAKLRFADIACGSGSFLVEVFACLIRYHLKWYLADGGEKWAKKGILRARERDDEYVLTLAEKRRLLLNNVYGVDLDPQAVEVTQLSLYLRLMEDESFPSTQLLFDEERRALLPDLRENIICGNSLIETDVADLFGLGAEEQEKLRPLDLMWQFPQAFPRGKGGFDAIVGNPPYRMLQPHNTSETLLEYLRGHYLAANFKIDLFHLFLQRAISCVKADGSVGYILPTTLLNNVYAESLRRYVLSTCRVRELSVSRTKVFADADVHTSIVVLSREADQTRRAGNLVEITSNFSPGYAVERVPESVLKQSAFESLNGAIWNILITNQNLGLVQKVSSRDRLSEWAKINRGLITGSREKYFCDTKLNAAYQPILTGSDVRRYFVVPPKEFVLFERPDTAGGCWDREVHFAPHKILVRQIGEHPTAALLIKPVAVTGNVFTVRMDSLEAEAYALGVLNGRLIAWLWNLWFSDFKTSFPQVTIFSLEQLPIPQYTGNPLQRDIASRVTKIQAAKEIEANAPGGLKRDNAARQIDALDRQIDALVYELYGLTDEEIALVEGES